MLLSVFILGNLTERVMIQLYFTILNHHVQEASKCPGVVYVKLTMKPMYCIACPYYHSVAT